MATDTRERILRAAKQLAEENSSIQGVTISLESVSQQAGLTKPGLMYYFPSKEELMIGLIDHAAQHWAALLKHRTGSAPDELSAFDRYRAYIAVATSAEVSRADYWIFSEALYHSKLSAAWHHHLGPWYAAEGLSDRQKALLTTARFCGDGAWMSEATGVFPAENLHHIRIQATTLIDQAEQLPPEDPEPSS